MAGSTYIHRTPSGAGSSQKMTFSAWIKKTQSGIYQGIFTSIVDSNNWFQLNFENSEMLEFRAKNSGNYVLRKITNRKFRDPLSFYHILINVDTTLATEEDRAQIWVNGVRETSWQTNTAVSQNTNLSLTGTSNSMRVGRDEGGSNHFTGVMSHVHYIDGTAYAPTEFGETDASTGEWKIKTSPSVTYGTNGFFLKLEDKSNLDLDSSSNTHTMATVGTLTSTEDNPSNVFCTMNPLRIFGGVLPLSNGNLTCSAGGGWHISSGTLGANKGKYYYEYKITTLGSSNGYHKIGITSDIAGDDASVSHGADSDLDGGYVFYSQNGALEARTDQAVISGWDASSTGITFALNDVMCMALDMDNKFIYFRKNGDAWAKSGDPTSGATGTGGINISSDYPSDNSKFAIPTISGYSNGVGSVNFGNGYFGTAAISSEGTNASGIGKFEYDVPTGYTALSTKGLNE